MEAAVQPIQQGVAPFPAQQLTPTSKKRNYDGEIVNHTANTITPPDEHGNGDLSLSHSRSDSPALSRASTPLTDIGSTPALSPSRSDMAPDSKKRKLTFAEQQAAKIAKQEEKDEKEKQRAEKEKLKAEAKAKKDEEKKRKEEEKEAARKAREEKQKQKDALKQEKEAEKERKAKEALKKERVCVVCVCVCFVAVADQPRHNYALEPFSVARLLPQRRLPARMMPLWPHLEDPRSHPSTWGRVW